MKLFYPTQGNFIAVVGKLNQPMVVRRVKAAMQASSLLPVYSINAPRSVPGIDFSDHRNYWEVGYDAVMLTDTAFYRNPNYHTPRDTAEALTAAHGRGGAGWYACSLGPGAVASLTLALRDKNTSLEGLCWWGLLSRQCPFWRMNPSEDRL